jgi:adenylate kinase
MACSILSKGGLVGDDIVNRIVVNRIQKSDCANGYLLDGYPRTVHQALHFANYISLKQLPDPVIVHIDVPDDSLVARLTARRQCPKCLHIYNILSQPPREEGKCDADGAELLTRKDDKEAVIRDRLRAYHEQTGLVLEWYAQYPILRVDGSRPPAEVSKAIEEAIQDRPVPTLA